MTPSFDYALFWIAWCKASLNIERHFSCLRLATILKTSNNSVWSIIFWYVELCIFWNCIQYTTHWDKTQILKKFPSDKINGTKNALFFLRAPNDHSFIFNLQFLYEMKHMLCLSKKCVCEFPFWNLFLFYKSLLLFNKIHGLFDFKTP